MSTLSYVESGALGMTTLSCMEFAKKLSALREASGRSKYRVAKDAGIDQALYQRLETGERFPTPAVVEKLEAVFPADAVEELRAARARDLLVKVGFVDGPAQAALDRVDERAEYHRRSDVKDLKREALRDRLTPDELQAAAGIAAETALPPDTPPDQAAERFAEQGAEWFTFNSRAAKPEDEDKFWEAWMAVAEAKLRQRREQREKGTQ